MRILLIAVLLAQMSGRIPISKSYEEEVSVFEVTVPKTGQAGRAGFRYPKYGTGAEFLIRPRCYDVRDEQTGEGVTHPSEDITDQGFIVVAPRGHTVKVTCRTVRAKGPLAGLGDSFLGMREILLSAMPKATPKVYFSCQITHISH